ncbi:MAG: hypothetical protein ACD_49C00060G0014 [uncultured bacterium (gcode 4)]|uniref:Uncharacterized protein n=1 Tax=uncultured bacterium (gcode 4) TaxID=1234023 RepID=K2AWN1_9BACT|nr:MAG: hypothetical protein ACD_49C00060G0014 [uncultured bacterium (gcode 4)]
MFLYKITLFSMLYLLNIHQVYKYIFKVKYFVKIRFKAPPILTIVRIFPLDWGGCLSRQGEFFSTTSPKSPHYKIVLLLFLIYLKIKNQIFSLNHHPVIPSNLSAY